MSRGNPISRTGLLICPRKTRKLSTKSRSRVDLNLSNYTKSVQYSLRPFAGLFNPYSRNCSILCNHPGPNEIKDVVKQVKERDCKGILTQTHDICCDDVSCKLINITTSDDPQKLSDDYFHYADLDSRPLTPTPTIISNRTRVSQNSNFFHQRRCHTPDPINTCANERKQLVLDLRRSHSQETVYCNASEISIQADSMTLSSKSMMKIEQSPKNIRLCEQEARKKSAERKNALQMQKEEPVPSNVVCINDRMDIVEEIDGVRRRGKKKKKQKDGNTFRVNQEPETQIATVTDSPNASARPSMTNKNKIVKGAKHDSTVGRTRDSQYLRSNFITEDTLKILRRGLNIDIVESAFEKFMNTALKEALQTIPKDQFNTCSAALHEFKKTFGVENGVNHDKWLVMPRPFLRSAARFSLPINTQKLATISVFDYLSRYVWISDHRKHLYRFVFNKYICDTTGNQDADNENGNDDKHDLERDTPSRTTNDKSIQAYVINECVMPFKELKNAFRNVFGYCGPTARMADKIQTIIELTETNENDHSMINFRSWCGLVAFAERYLNKLTFEEDPCDEVEIADFETLERKFKYVTPSAALKRVLMIINYNQKK